MATKQAEAAPPPLRVKVNPIDRTKKGSRGERRRIEELSARARKYQATVEAAKAAEGAGVAGPVVDPDESLALMEERDAILKKYCEVEGGGDLEEAFDELSQDEYDALLTAILGGAAESSVPTTSGGSSNGSPKDSP